MQSQYDNTTSCISQLRVMRNKHQQFNKSNKPFGSFVTEDYYTLKTQLEPLNPWKWDDLTEQYCQVDFGSKKWGVCSRSYVAPAILIYQLGYEVASNSNWRTNSAHKPETGNHCFTCVHYKINKDHFLILWLWQSRIG